MCLNSKTFLIFAAFAVALVGVADPAWSAVSGTPAAVEVSASALNVRTGPSTGNAKIGLIHQGETYPVVGRSGEWLQRELGSMTGWSHGDYMNNSSAQVATVTASSLNVRSGPGTGYRVVGTVSRGTRVAVEGSSGSWRKIGYDGREAWVYGTYLDTSGATKPTTSTTPTTTTSTSRPRSRAGFIQLPSSGPGYYGYYSASRRWGTPTFVYGFERAARRFVTENSGRPRIGVGDISLMNGGDISGHASHERGVDGDFRPVKNNGTEGAVTRFQSTYSRTLTQRIVDLCRAEMPVTLIFFNDSRVRGVQNWPNHENHFHVRTSR